MIDTIHIEHLRNLIPQVSFDENREALKAAILAIEARAVVSELIDKAARHIYAVDYPVNDGDDAARQERTLRALNAALARIGGAL